MRTKGTARPSQGYGMHQLPSRKQPQDGTVLTVEFIDCIAVLPVQEPEAQQQGEKRSASSSSSADSSSWAIQVQWLPDTAGELHPYTLLPDAFDSDDDDSRQQLEPTSSCLLLQLQQHYQQLQQQPARLQQQQQCSTKQQDKQSQDKQQHDQQRQQQHKEHSPLQPTAATAERTGVGKATSAAGQALAAAATNTVADAAAAAAAAAWAGALHCSCCEHCGATHSMAWARTGAGACSKLTCSDCTQHYTATGKHRKLPGGLMAGLPGTLLRPPGSVLAAAVAAAAAAAETQTGVQGLDVSGLRICSNCASSITPYSWKVLQAASGHAVEGAAEQSWQQQEQGRQQEQDHQHILLCNACTQYQHLVGRPRRVAAADRVAAHVAAQQLLAAQRGVLQAQQRQRQQWLVLLERRRQLQRERVQRHRDKLKQHKQQQLQDEQQQRREGQQEQQRDASAAAGVSAGLKRRHSEAVSAGPVEAKQQANRTKPGEAAAAAAAAAAAKKPPKGPVANGACGSGAAASSTGPAAGGDAASKLKNGKQQLQRALSSTSSTTSSGSSAGQHVGNKPKPCSGGSPKPPGFKQLKRNLYMCRQRAALGADGVQVCSCSPSKGQCCRESDGCLNRLLKVCCTPGSCPAGDACQNTPLAKRLLPPLRVVPVGSKGWGVVAQLDIPRGALVAEYLGEVVTVAEGRRRLSSYASAGLTHTYLMDLSGQEVIDATVKGGIARFINHSCEPNCETQKWQDGGELVVAIVSTCRIPTGTELTYDYRYQSHVLPQARTRCCCGAGSCRGWLGSVDPQAHLQAQLEQHEEEAEQHVLCKVDARTGEEVRVDNLDPMDSEEGEEAA